MARLRQCGCIIRNRLVSAGVQRSRPLGGPDGKALYITESSQNIIYRVAMKVRGLKLFGDK